MQIHLIHHSKIEGASLSLFLRNMGFQVNVISKTAFLQRGEGSNELVLLLDANYLAVLDKSEIKNICKTYESIAVIGYLKQMYLFFELLENQAGYICRNEEVKGFLKTIKGLNGNEYSLSPSILKFICKSRILQQEQLLQHGLAKYLTKTELKIMKEVMEGRKAKEIAEIWNRSIHTIYNHRKNVMRKLKLDGIFRLNKFCYNKRDAILTLLSLYQNHQLFQKLNLK
ncbi:LuxR C-terminal-related transcriptional regulator [Aliifodinibius sp. S!AR15-10]|uniref:helix-turn-helix transcriptional regulator n=1 Tax=Aliifodinibius sp. S!AR15-10 TaxID=2950437 RepID=UPI0028612497|nr:LuxR C-terminal-related transcriptional regulator [Aliifodinibius sp. S!AR15-10]MDR8389592.1 LuxR C-terminal-related transcriptional regulator [Aliifodinibius sp. S!AR15-10]